VTVAPPDQTAWWDETATTAAVLAQLRLTGTDVDAARIGELVGAAGQAINAYLDQPDATPPAPLPILQAALEQVTIELYRRKDAGAANPTDYAVAAVVSRYGATDPLGDVRAQLLPYKRRWGVG
jgi:hypothetical protein